MRRYNAIAFGLLTASLKNVADDVRRRRDARSLAENPPPYVVGYEPCVFLRFVLTVLVFTAGLAHAQNGNPFAAPSTLPFHAPRFDQIKDSDYLPAFDEGIKEQLAEID